MDYDVASVEFFNTLPETPEIVRSFFDPKSEGFIALPLHRHGILKKNHSVLWTVHDDRLVARQEPISDASELFPMFWTKNAEGGILAYEFVSQDTFAKLGGDKSALLKGAFESLDDPTLPAGYGVSSLWPAYTGYLTSNNLITDSFIDQQEQLVRQLLPKGNFLSSSPTRETGLFCQGIQLSGVDCRVNFAEVDVKDDVHLFVVSQDFMESMKDEVNIHTLYAGGGWIGHGIVR